MAEVSLPVGSGSSGGGIAGIPTKWLAIGAGGLVVMFLLLRSKGGGTSEGAGGEALYGSALGPNAALALGGLQSQLMQESGYLQELWTQQAAALGDQSTRQYQNILQSIFGSDQSIMGSLVAELRAQDLNRNLAGVTDQEQIRQLKYGYATALQRDLASLPWVGPYYRQWLIDQGISPDTGEWLPQPND